MNKPYNPAQEGIDAVRAENKSRDKIVEHLNEFKSFVIDQLAEGMKEEGESELNFIARCWECYQIHYEDIGE